MDQFFDSNNIKNNHNKSNDKIDITFSKKDLLKRGLYTLYIIPYKIDEYKLIRDIHENIIHRNLEDTSIGYVHGLPYKIHL